MKMKNFRTPFVALMIIGLLVITGCQGLFEPPTKPSADGDGTLVLSINGKNARTILPTAAVDEYSLELFVGEGATEAAFEGLYPTTLQGSTALSLPADTYRIVVKGLVNDEVVAQGDEQDIVVVTGEAVSVTIILTPEEEGDGIFSWDFSAVTAGTNVAIKIYDIDDTGLATDLLAGETVGLTGEFELAAGVYNVKITAGDAAWLEVLYIYPGLTSAYNATSALVEFEVIEPIYVVPESGLGFFYLNLNNWETPTTSEGSRVPDVPEGELAEDNLKVTFTKNGQMLNIKLSSEQATLMTESGSISVTITGSATPDSTGFRFFLTDPTAGGNWNATSNGNEGAISGILGVAKTTPITEDRKDARVGYFSLQVRADTSTEVTIESIKIEYPIYKVPTGGHGYFYLDLNDWQTAGVESINPNVPAGVLARNDLTATFTEQAQRLNIGLTEAQIALVSDSRNIEVTITGSATPSTTSFRFHLGDPSLGGGWNATNQAYEGAIENFLNVPKWTDFNAGNKSAAKFLILQFERFNGSPTATAVTIESIRIDYSLTPEEGWFYLDLSKAIDAEGEFIVGTSEGSLNNTPVTGSYTDGTLTASFTENGQRLHIPLAEGQIAILNEANEVYATIKGTATPDTTGFRYHLADPQAGGSWNATNNSQEGPIANILAGIKTGDLGFGGNKSEETLSHLTLQQRAVANTTVNLTSVRLDYKIVAAPIVPATEDYVVFRSTALGGTDTPVINATAIAGSWATLSALNDAVAPIVFPEGLQAKSYSSFTIRVKYYLNDGSGGKGAELTLTAQKQWGQVNIEGVDHYNLSEEGVSGGTINAPISDAWAGKTQLSVNFQGRNNWENVTDGTHTGNLGFVELHEVVFNK